MGLKNSKKNTGQSARESSFIPPNQTRKYDDLFVNQLRDDLDENPEMFILNNILLSIQFYENFDSEMETLRKNQISNREIELNKSLTDFQKHCLLPDSVMESVNERVRFRPFHGPKKFESEPLLPQRMFIIHDNIEVLYEGETSEYSTVDGPIHRAVIERAEKQGYVQIKQIEFIEVKNKTNEEVDVDIKEKSDEKFTPTTTSELSPPNTPEKQRLFSKNSPTSPSIFKDTQFIFNEDQINERRISDARKLSLRNKLLRTQSFNLTSSKSISTENIQMESKDATNLEENDNEYGYTNLRLLTTPKPLHETRANKNISNITSLSANCITEVKIKKISFDDNDSDNEEDQFLEDGRRKPPIKKKTEDFFEIKRYFNSKEFFAHFGDVFGNIYETLGFSEEAFHGAMTEGGRIHCNALDKNGNKIYYEIIPSIATAWPELAYEWNLRTRNQVRDPNMKTIYKWPTDRMCAKIKSLQSYILPIGFIAKRGINENSSLEWSLSFPAAERYMETCMSHSQIRCYLFILALYKTFMEPKNTKLGLVPHHILTLIFWEAERNFITWPENRLGLKMINILKLLYEHLARGHLPDYFVRERNLLESSPSKYLRISQSKLHDIIERPVAHVLLAMRNLRYTSGTFFPTLNFKNLYRIITTNNSLSLIHPNLATLTENNMDKGKPEETNELKENRISFWNKMHKNEDRERRWKRELRKQKELEKKEQQENLKKMHRVSVDSINLEVTVSKLDTHKRRVLLEFFIQHFLKVVNKCVEYKSYNYALNILEYSHALAILLGEEPSGEIEARPLKKTILEEIEKCRSKINQSKSRIISSKRQQNGVKFNLSNLENNSSTSNGDDDQVVLRKKERPTKLQITAEIHQKNGPILSVKNNTPSVKSFILENEDSFIETSEL